MSANEYTDKDGVRYVAKPPSRPLFSACYGCAHESEGVPMTDGCRAARPCRIDGRDFIWVKAEGGDQ